MRANVAAATDRLGNIHKNLEDVRIMFYYYYYFLTSVCECELMVVFLDVLLFVEEFLRGILAHPRPSVFFFFVVSLLSSSAFFPPRVFRIVSACFLHRLQHLPKPTLLRACPAFELFFFSIPMLWRLFLSSICCRLVLVSSFPCSTVLSFFFL
jgi:hypothetical protein